MTVPGARVSSQSTIMKWLAFSSFWNLGALILLLGLTQADPNEDKDIEVIKKVATPSVNLNFNEFSPVLPMLWQVW